MNTSYDTFPHSVLKNDVKERIEERRIVWPTKEMKLRKLSELPEGCARAELLNWIDHHTEGKFYLGGSHIGFENEGDELFFRLRFNVD